MGVVAELDILLRGGAIAVILLTAVAFILRDGMARKSLSVATLCLAIAAYLVVSSPHIAVANGYAGLPLILLAAAAPALVYWAGIELFKDQVALKWWHAVLAFIIIFGAWLQPWLPGAAGLRGIVVVVVYLHLLVIALRTSSGDLVESRRQFRRWFLSLMAILGTVITIVELSDLDAALPNYVFPLHAAAFLALAILFAVWALQVRGDIWVEASAQAPAQDSALPPAAAAVLKRLQRAMAEEIWREEGLTIGRLATYLDTPEHRLRQVINQGLGYRNFAAFINEQRIECAKTILSDPAQADIPILTIAHDVGFGSLGPFNRAFRDAANESPTAFRKRQGGNRP